jgi:thiosulfate/3-mercaptopyruvate sulfurtransferase
MTYAALIDSQTLAQQLDNPDWIIVDCRFDLADARAGESAYLAAHIPGAVYAHLDDDLSGPPATDDGRHPLPTPDALRTLFSRLGIDETKQVVVYDGHYGAIGAARLWWMLRYMGHTAVAVLDGGWQIWQAEDRPMRSGRETNPPTQFEGEPWREWLVQYNDLPRAELLVDARDAARYRGEIEPIDAYPGRIPGAAHYHFMRNLGVDGRFHSPEKIRQQLEEVVGEKGATAVHYCGSGVSACLNLLAHAHAGLPPGKLYVGSWSEWSRKNPKREA